MDERGAVLPGALFALDVRVLAATPVQDPKHGAYGPMCICATTSFSTSFNTAPPAAD